MGLWVGYCHDEDCWKIKKIVIVFQCISGWISNGKLLREHNEQTLGLFILTSDLEKKC